MHRLINEGRWADAASFSPETNRLHIFILAAYGQNDNVRLIKRNRSTIRRKHWPNSGSRIQIGPSPVGAVRCRETQVRPEIHELITIMHLDSQAALKAAAKRLSLL